MNENYLFLFFALAIFALYVVSIRGFLNKKIGGGGYSHPTLYGRAAQYMSVFWFVIAIVFSAILIKSYFSN